MKFIYDGKTFIKSFTNLNQPCINSVHPYDLTEYHWAYKARENDGVSEWVVMLNSKRKGTFLVCEDLEDTDEAVAMSLIEYDKNARLKPNIDRT